MKLNVLKTAKNLISVNELKIIWISTYQKESITIHVLIINMHIVLILELWIKSIEINKSLNWFTHIMFIF